MSENDKLKKRAAEILKRLEKEYPAAKCHLEFRNPFELLVSTILSAQCTDARVNMIMTPLYENKYKSPDDILADGLENFRENIKSCNFFNNKAKSVLAICNILKKDYNGKVPDSLEELTKLPGIGRKSANVILGNCFGKKDVIIVDTHFKRVTGRLGLTDNDEPEKIEADLKKLIPPAKQYVFSHVIGDHGRYVCGARKPKCGVCVLNDVCPSDSLKK
ncbi:MAG: endonuclease III [Ignavibacteria bacterium]|nr:endonuclease III [Ignavibacteria bacterium]